MKSFGLILILLALSTQAFDEEDGVLVLHDQDFDSAFEAYEYLLIEFYAPWCGHCKKLAPEYSKAALEIKSRGLNNIALAKVDATVEKEASDQFDIKGFPTILYFTKATGKTQPISYEGPRSASEIVNFLIKKSGPASTEIKSIEDLERITQNVAQSPVVVYFGSEQGESEFQTYQRVAAVGEGAEFYHTFELSAREHFNLGANELVVIFKSFDEKRNIYQVTPLLEEPLLQYITINLIPTVIPFGQQAIQSIFQDQNTGLILFINDNEESQIAFEHFSAAAAQYKEKIKFTFSKPNDASGLFSRLADYVGADQNKLPGLMLIEPANSNAKYQFSQEITQENIQVFLNQFLAGELVRYLKSEEIPATNDEPVKIIVGKNFKDLVINNDQDVLVEFYAPWCGHCKQLAPIWEQVAIKLKQNTHIVIAKCDSTVNEIPEVDISSFPTLKFFKNGQKDTPIPYSGDRDFEGIMEFLKQNTSHPWVQREEDL